MGDIEATAIRAARERVLAVRSELARAAADDQRVWSVDGGTFRFDVVGDDPVPVGDHVELTLPDDTVLLGQVTAAAPGQRPGPSLTLDDVGLGPGGHVEVRVPVRSVVGGGVVLGALDGDRVVAADRRGFDAATMAPASSRALAASVTAATSRGSIRLGTVLGRQAGVDLRAKGFGRHTFVCGQSGSGKTYTIGRLLEQLLLRTTLPIVALDPNSDYVTITQPRAREETGLDEVTYDEQCARLDKLASQVLVFGEGHDRLAVRFGRLGTDAQALVLGLDPVADLDAYGVLRRGAEQAGPDATFADFLAALEHVDGGAALAQRARNLGVDGWSVWAREDDPTVGERLAGGWRAVVVDLGSVPGAEERAAMAAEVLGQLWAQRHERQPRLVLVDEAHNVCPAVPTGAAQQAAAGLVRAIAAEGRKYGLYLLLATQEPHKVHPDVLSQCANLLLMRTTSQRALDTLASVFSDLPPDLVQLASTLQQGQGVVAGRIAPHPLLFSTDRRLTRDGGQDVPATWVTEVPA